MIHSSHIARRVAQLERTRETKSDHADFRQQDGRIFRMSKEAALEACSDALAGRDSEAAGVVLNSTHTRGFGRLAELARMVTQSPDKEANVVEFPSTGLVQ